MNKHQEALNKLYNDACMYENQKSSIKEKDLLQELIDKAKSMKPEMIPYEGYLIEEATYQGCPSCKEPIHRDWKMFERNKLPKFCQECGRKFDWSEDE